MFWCNCTESWLAKGQKFSKTTLDNGYSYYQVVHPTSKNLGAECPHCGHIALFSKTDPNQEHLITATSEPPVPRYDGLRGARR